MIPIYAICGIAYGMVELIRRIIPRDIVGADVQKLRKMDSVVSASNSLSHHHACLVRSHITFHDA